MAQIGETELDVRALSRALWRRAWLPALLAIIAAVLTYVALGYVEPLYTADTSILIEERESPLTRPREGAEPRNDFDEPAIQSQVEVIRSREIAEAVIEKLDLTNRPEFDPAANPSFVTSLMVLLGMREHPVEESIGQRAMDIYFERLSVYPLAQSRVIGVAFQAPSPTLAADVANAIADTFVELQQQAQRESAIAATAWLEQEIERLRERVAEAEQAIAGFRTDNELFGSGESGSLSEQQLNDLNAELARARAARAEAEARAALIESLLADGGSLEASEEVLASQLIQRLRERQVALQAQIAELSTTLLPGHPRIRALQGQLANMDAQIRQEAERVLASLNTAARVAAAREESLLASLNLAMAEVSRTNVQEIELRALEREAAAQRDLLESFLGRYREAVARTDSDYLPADARIISRAVAPQEPSYPKKAMMSVVVAIAVFLIATAFLLLQEFTSGRAFRVISLAPVGTGTAVVPAERVSVVEIEVRPSHDGPPPLRPARDVIQKFEPPPAFQPVAERDISPPREEDVEPDVGEERDLAANVEHAPEGEREARAIESEIEDWPEAESRSGAGITTAGSEAIVETWPDVERSTWRDIESETAIVEPEFDRELEPRDEAPAETIEAASTVTDTAFETVAAQPSVIEPDAEAWPESAAEFEPAATAEAHPSFTETPAAVDVQIAEAPIATEGLLTQVGDGTRDSITATDVEPSTDAGWADAVPPPAPVAEVAEAKTDEAALAAASPPVGAGEVTPTAADPVAPPESLPDDGTTERDPPGTAELAEIVSGDAVRVALFTGAEGGEGAGEIAYATARQVVRRNQRCVVVDVGSRPAPALGGEGEPGLGELLAGEFSFGEVIRRDEPSNVHVIPLGKTEQGAPLQRLQLVIGALTHTYDKVIVVADAVADWPGDHLRPDLAAIVCGPDSTEFLRTQIYDEVLERGARSAIIVRFASDGDSGGLKASAAA